MSQFKAYSPTVEILGEIVLFAISGMGAFESLARRILSQNGIDDPQPKRWYSQQAWLDAFKTIAEEVGPTTLTLIGNMIPATAVIDPDVDTIDKALAKLDEAYRSAHRGGEVGHYSFTRTSDKSATIVCSTPNPCDFDRGVIEALARRFEPTNVVLDVKHDDFAPCKKRGADSCIFDISW